MKNKLEELYNLLLEFPFSQNQKNYLNTLDLNGIKKETFYNEDDLGKAVYWCATTLQNLINEKPVRDLDEVLSYAKMVLEDC